jgi:hypothetical protein
VAELDVGRIEPHHQTPTILSSKQAGGALDEADHQEGG